MPQQHIDALTVPCPRCGAHEHHPCYSHAGAREMRIPHVARVTAHAAQVIRDAQTVADRVTHRECPHCGAPVALGNVCGCCGELHAPRPSALAMEASEERARAWTAIGLRLNPEELTALDVYREKGIVPLSRAESARALIRRALGIGKAARR